MAEIDNRNSWNPVGDFERPSGSEVDAAAFVSVPVFETREVTVVMPPEPGLKEKIDGYRKQGLDQLHRYQAAAKQRASELKHTAKSRADVISSDLSHRAAAVRTDVTRRADVMKADLTQRANVMKADLSRRAAVMQSDLKRRAEGLKVQASQKSAELQRDMHEQPTKWAGIATGAGIAVGLIGRIMRHRAKVRRYERLHSPQQIVIIEASC